MYYASTFMLMGAFFIILIVRSFVWSSFLFLNYFARLKAHFPLILLKQENQLLYTQFIKNSGIFLFLTQKRNFFFRLFSSLWAMFVFSYSIFFLFSTHRAYDWWYPLNHFPFPILLFLPVVLLLAGRRNEIKKSLTNNHHHVKCIRREQSVRWSIKSVCGYPDIIERNLVEVYYN